MRKLTKHDKTEITKARKELERALARITRFHARAMQNCVHAVDKYNPTEEEIDLWDELEDDALTVKQKIKAALDVIGPLDEFEEMQAYRAHLAQAGRA